MQTEILDCAVELLKTLGGYRRSSNVTAQAFQLVPFMCSGANACVKRKTGDIANPGGQRLISFIG